MAGSSKSLGTLTLDVIAKIGGFQAGMGSAQREAERRAKAIQNAFDKAGTAIGVSIGLGVTAAVASFAAFDHLVKAAGDFQDLAEKTGSSAEALASFAVAAKIGGASMDDVASASIRLSKNLTGVDDDSKAAGAALTALGLNLKDIKDLAPEDQIEAIAKAMGNFADGSNKVAVAQALFGKSGAQLLPFLKELGTGIGRVNILTEEQIKNADDYADAQSKSRAQLELYAQSVATTALPAVTALNGAVTDLLKGFLDAGNAGADLANSKVGEFAQDAARFLATLGDIAYATAQAFNVTGKSIAAAAAIGVAYATRNFAGIVEIAKAYKEQIAQVQFSAGLLDALDARLAVQNQIKQGRGYGFKDPRILGSTEQRPQVNYTGAASAAKAAAADRQTAAEKYLENLQKQLEKTEDLTAVEQVLKDVQMGRIKGITEAQEINLLEIANQIDAAKELAALTKAQQEYGREAATAEGDAVTKANDAYRERIKLLTDGTPSVVAQQQKEDAEFLIQAFEDGSIAATTYNEAIAKLYDTTKSGAKESKSLVEELGLSFTSAFEDAIVSGKGLSDVLKGLEADIIRIVTRKLVTEPLGDAFTKLLKGSGSGGSSSGGGLLDGIFSKIGSLFTFDGGGYTGSGSRAGGMDGQGGFLAMLHPNETVIDHTKPNGPGGRAGITINQSFAPGTDRTTINQAAAAASRQLQLANARGN